MQVQSETNVKNARTIVLIKGRRTTQIPDRKKRLSNETYKNGGLSVWRCGRILLLKAERLSSLEIKLYSRRLYDTVLTGRDLT